MIIQAVVDGNCSSSNNTSFCDYYITRGQPFLDIRHNYIYTIQVDHVKYTDYVTTHPDMVF